MRTHPLLAALPILLAAATILPACTQSRAEALRSRSATVERKLTTERDRVLADPTAAERESGMSHLQALRLGLSMVNVSIVTVPLVLTSEDERAIGYTVLDEAIGTIDWNIPLHGPAAPTTQRPYPALFSPQSGLDFNAIRRNTSPQGK